MWHVFCSFFLIIISNIIFCQYVFSGPSANADNYFASKVFQSGIGSLGFDNEQNFFNPHYQTRLNDLRIMISGNYLKQYSDRHILMGLNKESSPVILPDLTASYRMQDYLFQLHFANTILMDNKYVYTEWASTAMTVQEVKVSNYEFQFDVSRLISEYVSLTAGLSTDYYYNSSTFSSFKNVYKIIYSLKPGTAAKYSASINYDNLNGLKFYIFFKSMIYRAEMDERYYRINNVRVRTGGNINYPGILSLGVQYKLWNPVRLSLEYYEEYFSEDSRPNRKILIPGFNIRPIKSLVLGALFGYQLSTERAFDHWNGIILESSSDSYFGIFSMAYKYSRFSINTHFQFIHAYYFDNQHYELLSESQKIRLSLGIEF